MTSIDTNVISALLEADDALSKQAENALDQAAQNGRLCICLPVYAELIAKPKRSVALVDTFLSTTRIEVDSQFDTNLWTIAGLAFGVYTSHRKKEKSSLPRRILADFLIGAHAQESRHTLLTLDSRVYKASFPKLALQSLGEA
jgi:predicted nucleic acid-binding protein